ncbi:MAG: sigma-70 family RNA polymerase sigma factor [Verrucomicrobiales bacterium]|jgi:RNA polymerase sigma-70 factor (ECF subfamily)|nr:sigma-70 family RNA polymerase sigma factor [Verrucomicrobiales bacterium]
MSDSPSEPVESIEEDALDAQVRCFLESRSMIQAHIRSLVRNASLADDLFQEVWMRFERVTRRGEQIENVTAWCRAAARLVALESWRKQGRELSLAESKLSELVDQAYAEQDGREDYWKAHRSALAVCLEALPERSRELVSRFYHREQSVAQIAQALGRTEGSIKTALCRVRKSLGDCVRRRETTTPFPS